MNREIAIAFGAFVALAAAAAHGQEPSPPDVDSGYVFGRGSAVDGSARGGAQSPALFTIGGMNVRVWAPMEPHYNTEADRDPAAEPLWGAG